MKASTGGSADPPLQEGGHDFGSGGSLDPPSDTRAADIGAAAQLACLLEASAPKPGNVSPGRHFADIRYEDFLASAVAIGGPIAGAGTRSVGATVRLAIEATARWATSNTNLGIVLLLAPLARAALVKEGTGSLRDSLRCVLEKTTVDDARDVYAAIRQARPGGLGQAEEQDVAEEPTLTLLEVMRLAADRDGIAREYATAFEVTFEIGAPALDRARRDGLPGTMPSSRRSSRCSPQRQTRMWPGGAAPPLPKRSRGGRGPRFQPAVSALRLGDARSTKWTPRCVTRATPATPVRRRT